MSHFGFLIAWTLFEEEKNQQHRIKKEGYEMKEDEWGGWNKNLSGTRMCKPAYGGRKNSEYK